ncbi:EAL and HDOD domain-containing protein [Thiobacillus sp.]|uniref:EAL and HDOD domain-containing protein n=1 Tax=Thiobacillus sp. TaxID=924 RepID=UPI00286EAC06|nr:HDOD domain-containing protein [Thiobacillus sp.]
MLGRLVGMLSGNKPTPDTPPPPAAKAAASPAPQAAPAAKPGSVMRREAMLGRDQKVAAYAFMLRRAPDELRDASLPEVQRLYDETLLNNLTNMDVARLLAQRQAFIPISVASLSHPLIADWPAAGTVWHLKVGGNTTIDEALLARLTEMKAAGHSFALDADALLSPARHPLLAFVDYVLLNVSSEDIPTITNQMAAISKLASGKQFVATEVQTLEAFHMCHKLQFARFMGPFITRHENLNSPVLGPSRAKVLDLMNRVRTGAEQSELVENFRHDPALSVRLLRYVNSPGIGLLHKVGGIEQALMIMGQDKLYRWLTLILFTGGQAQDLDQAVLENALVRARVAEQLASKALFAKARDEVFVTGLFSLLDVVMRMPMEQVLKQVSLPVEITEAIVSQNGPYAPYLGLAIACEQDDLGSIETLSAQIGRDVAEINAIHMDALLWTQELAVDV